jgi:hypothetical protein
MRLWLRIGVVIGPEVVVVVEEVVILVLASGTPKTAASKIRCSTKSSSHLTENNPSLFS